MEIKELHHVQNAASTRVNFAYGYEKTIKMVHYFHLLRPSPLSFREPFFREQKQNVQLLTTRNINNVESREMSNVTIGNFAAFLQNTHKINEHKM